MRIGLIDVDGHNFPNIPLMKLSAWHKNKGDTVEWYSPLFSGHMDKVYMSKVFSFTPDYEYFVDADEVVKGGSGYNIRVVDGVEEYVKENDPELPYEIEHIYPDYSLYPEQTGYGKKLKHQTAYGFLSRGCPRNCDFCHVAQKEGMVSHKVADLSEFWRGQGNIELMDPNLLAVAGGTAEELLLQLIDSGAKVNVNQGFDARLLTPAKIELIKQIRLTNIHFAWDRIEDENIVIPKLKMFTEMTGIDHRKITVYVLTNKNSTHEEDLHRIYTLRAIGCNPYVMIYRRETTKSTDLCRRVQRWVNNRFIWESTPTFEEYMKRIGE